MLAVVRACVLLSNRFISHREVDSADISLVEFCRRFELLYGKEKFTPNMHLHLHLKATFMNFGPAHAFWCFPFERYNGILGSYHTNKKAIKVQVMTQFCHEQSVRALDLPSDVTFLRLLPTYYDENDASCMPPTNASLLFLSLSRDRLDQILSFANNGMVTTLLPHTEQVLDDHQMNMLSFVYTELYPSQIFHHIPPFVQRYGRVKLCHDIIGSDLPGQNNRKSSVIMAHWPGTGNQIRHGDYSRLRVGVVQYFLKHTVTVRTESRSGFQPHEHVFAYVYWKKFHPESNWFGISAVVCLNMFEPIGPPCFIPVQHIACRCAHVVHSVQISGIVERVFIACPIPIKMCI